jgi:prephenate dehydrogenase
VNLAAKLLPEKVSFVGSHPMAGSEKRGVEYARADLFANALCIVTPTASTPPEATRSIDHFWKTLGMRTIRLSPEEHDAAVADISHLPHILAAALVAMQAHSALPLAGKGFLDTTRIASGDAQLWRDILLDNKDNLTASLSRLEKQLASLRKLLTPAKSEALVAWLSHAAARREQLVQQRLRDASGE